MTENSSIPKGGVTADKRLTNMRIGILGGTFDPPHYGHLLIAEEARANLQLARVVFVPAAQPPHKLDDPVSPLHDRVAMLRLALDNNPNFILSLIEAERQGPSYTVDTIRELRQKLPAGTEIFFIMGMDSLADLPTWHKPRELIELCCLAILKRPGYSVDLVAHEEKIPGLASRVKFIPSPELAISSTELQSRVRQGLSIQYMVPRAVADYIHAHHLYQAHLSPADR